MQLLSYLIIPVILVFVSLMIIFSKKPLFDSFLNGAKNGLAVSIKLMPTLIILICAISMFSASGAADYIVKYLSPIFEKLNIPAEIVPLLIIRPVSGSGSTALASEIFEKYGPDSFIGLVTSVIMGSSDTIIYICAVYFGAVSVKKTRHALPAAFLTMIFGIFFACFVCKLFFV